MFSRLAKPVLANALAARLEGIDVVRRQSRQRMS
jgi:hypothetical protein